MISKEKNFIFIHIPKTAGTSIEKFVGHFETLERGAQDHRTVREIMRVTLPELTHVALRKGIPQAAREVRGVFRYPERLKRGEFDGYFKFAFVRNPWARVFSWYKNVLRDSIHQKKRRIPADCTLVQFLTQFGKQSELRPQLDWISDRRGRIPMDFIGRFERLGQDMQEICDHLGLAFESFPHLVKGGKEDYRDRYDDRSRRLISDRYAEEIEMFDYTFDNGVEV